MQRKVRPLKFIGRPLAAGKDAADRVVLGRIKRGRHQVEITRAGIEKMTASATLQNFKKN